MSEYRFSQAERYAVFTTHREQCWLCGDPLYLSDMQIDHIIPERLEGSPDLADVLRQYGLPSDFQINSFQNWMPAHARCNGKKAGDIFSPTPLIQAHLEIARKRASKAEELCNQLIKARHIDRAISVILDAFERGQLSDTNKAQLEMVIAFHEEKRSEKKRGQAFLLSPGLEVIEEKNGFLLLRGPGGLVGARPKGENLHSSWDCPNCGVTGWNGVRCIRCGAMDDGW